MDAQGVQPHDLPGLQRQRQHVFDLGRKRQPVRGAGHDQRQSHPGQRQRGDQGRVRRRVARDIAIGALAARRGRRAVVRWRRGSIMARPTAAGDGAHDGRAADGHRAAVQRAWCSSTVASGKATSWARNWSSRAFAIATERPGPVRPAKGSLSLQRLSQRCSMPRLLRNVVSTAARGIPPSPRPARARADRRHRLACHQHSDDLTVTIPDLGGTRRGAAAAADGGVVVQRLLHAQPLRQDRCRDDEAPQAGSVHRSP